MFFYSTRSFLIIFVFFSFLFSSCKEKTNTKENDCLILKADLNKSVVMPLDRLFEKIELIPLETTENSLISNLSYVKYVYSDNKHYILDISQAILFIFNQDGSYHNHIDKKGLGPGEYTLIYDFLINPQKRQIEMLSPYKYIYCYDFDGNFIKLLDFSFIDAPNIQRVNILDDENYIVWSDNYTDKDCISIISQNTGELVNSFWQDHMLFNLWAGNVFYHYNNETYFCLRLYNNVYKVTKDGFDAVYEWNLGDKTLDISQHKLATTMENVNRDRDNMLKLLEDKILPYEFSRHNRR